MKSKNYQTVRCSNPACLYAFDVAVEKLGRNIRCPNCEQTITARPLDAWKAMEEQQARLAGARAGSDIGRVDLTVVVDDVRSLLNVGSIFRTSDGAGIRELLLCGITGAPEPPNATIRKTALGAEQSVPWRYFAFVAEALGSLKESGRRIVGLEESPGARPFFEWLQDGLPSIDGSIDRKSVV